MMNDKQGVTMSKTAPRDEAKLNEGVTVGKEANGGFDAEIGKLTSVTLDGVSVNKISEILRKLDDDGK